MGSAEGGGVGVAAGGGVVKDRSPTGGDGDKATGSAVGVA